MKFFHLADLHIGKNVNGFSMLEDQRYILCEIVKRMDEHQPDAVIIAGDIYDRQTPGIEAVKLFDDFLKEIAARETTLLAVSGNHDSPERLGFGASIMNSKGIYMYGGFTGQMQKVTLSDAFGQIDFHLLPFVKPSFVRPFYENIESYEEAVRVVIDAGNVDFSGRNVVISHQFVTWGGGNPVLSQSEIGPVGGIDQVDARVFKGFDYVALGHLHGPQKIMEETIRYAGSPLKYSFSESSHKKSITLVEIGKKGQAVRLSFLPLVPFRDMRQIRGPLQELVRPEIVAAGNRLDYIHVTLTDEAIMLDPMGKLRNAYPNVMGLTFERTTSDGKEKSLDLQDAAIDPMVLFEEFFLMQNGIHMSGKQKKAVKTQLEKEAELL